MRYVSRGGGKQSSYQVALEQREDEDLLPAPLRLGHDLQQCLYLCAGQPGTPSASKSKQQAIDLGHRPYNQVHSKSRAFSAQQIRRVGRL